MKKNNPEGGHLDGTCLLRWCCGHHRYLFVKEELEQTEYMIEMIHTREKWVEINNMNTEQAWAGKDVYLDPWQLDMKANQEAH